jgi:uncharacterized protein YecT (DUF1311 family)/sugar lactone lactonase YvrE
MKRCAVFRSGFGPSAPHVNIKMKQYILNLALLIVPLVALTASHTNAQSQAQMDRQAAKDFEKADAELNRTYAALIAKLPDAESKRKLRESQRAWIAFRDAEAAFAADQLRDGSAAPVLRWTNMTQTTEQRVKQLKADFPDGNDASNKTLQPTSAAGAAGPSSPMGLAFDRSGNLFVGDVNSGSIFKLTPDGAQSTFASGLAPSGLAFDRSGNLFVAETHGTILKFPPDGTKSTFATGSSFYGMALDGAGNVFAGDGNTIFKFTPDGKKSTFAPGIGNPVDLTFDDKGNLFVVDQGSRSILKFSPDGTRTTFVSGLGYPTGLTVDGAGDLFVADQGSHSILKFSPDGTKATFASGLSSPYFETFDRSGNLFVSERDSGRIFKFAPDGTKSTFPKGTTSPDKQWEYQWPDGENPIILKAGTTQVVLDLSEDLEVAPPFASEAMVVWAPDSKRFAFNYRPGSRYNTTALYQLRGGKWVALRSPETDETSKPLERVMAAQLRKLGLPPKTYRRSLSDITRVREWVGPDTAILYCSSSAGVESKNEERSYLEATFLFTLKFDEGGNWKIIKTHRMSDKEIEEHQ